MGHFDVVSIGFLLLLIFVQKPNTQLRGGGGWGSFGLNQTQIVIDFSQSLSLPPNTVNKYLIKKILQTLRKIFLILC